MVGRNTPPRVTDIQVFKATSLLETNPRDLRSGTTRLPIGSSTLSIENYGRKTHRGGKNGTLNDTDK